MKSILLAAVSAAALTLTAAPVLAATAPTPAPASAVQAKKYGKWGIDLTTYYSSQGVLDVVMHRSWNDSAVYGGYGFIIDPAFVEWKYLRDTRLKKNVEAPDYDGMKDEYLTEAGMKIANEAAHAKIVGVTG